MEGRGGGGIEREREIKVSAGTRGEGGRTLGKTVFGIGSKTSAHEGN